MKKQYVYSSLFSVLLLSSITPALQAQEQSRVGQAIATIEHYAGKAQQKLNKIIQCVRGNQECSQSELRQTKVILGILGGALVILTLTGIGKRKGWFTGRGKKHLKDTPELEEKEPYTPTEYTDIAKKQKLADLLRSEILNYISKLKKEDIIASLEALKPYFDGLNPYEMVPNQNFTWHMIISRIIADRDDIRAEEVKNAIGRQDWPKPTN